VVRSPPDQATIRSKRQFFLKKRCPNINVKFNSQECLHCGVLWLEVDDLFIQHGTRLAAFSLHAPQEPSHLRKIAGDGEATMALMKIVVPGYWDIRGFKFLSQVQTSEGLLQDR